jgi:hypothetical protein
MSEIISLRLKETNLHLESSPGITRDEFIAGLSNWSQSSPNSYSFGSGQNKDSLRLSLKVPPGVSLDISVTEGILSIGNLQGSHQVQVIAGELVVLGYRGSLELELRLARATLLQGEGVLRARMKKSRLECSSSFQETWMHSLDSEVLVKPSKSLEGKLEIQGKGSIIVIDPEDKDTLMVQAQGNNFHHFGNQGSYFVTIMGKQSSIGFEKPDKWGKDRIRAESILQESQDLMNLFDQYEDKIEALYEQARTEEHEEKNSENSKSTAVKGKNFPARETYLLSLAREGKIGLDELERLLEDES